MTPATNPTPRTARSQTREELVVQLLTAHRGEKLTASDIATALVSAVENVRTAIKRLHKRGEICKQEQRRLFKVGNSTCKHKVLFWYLP